MLSRRVAIGALVTGEPGLVCARVVATGSHSARLVDSTAGVLVTGLDVVPGDLVAVEGVLDAGGILAASSCLVVKPYRGSREFPDPAGEFARLQPRLQNLMLRARILDAIRGYFRQHDFFEVEAPLRVPSPGLELHLDAVASEERWLITSPEYQLKRMLAAGAERVYSMGRCFRRGERGAQHNPEFTMLEWYRAWQPYQSIMVDIELMVSSVARTVLGHTAIVLPGGRALELAPPWPRLTVADAMQRHAGFSVHGDETTAELAAKIAAAGLPAPPRDAPWDDLFFHAFLTAVEPKLGLERPCILYEWPAPLAALARAKPGDPRVVERFEVYAGGLELANAFGELTCPVEQRRRFEHELSERAARGRPAYPIDERFLSALDEGMPPSAGIALGVDRLVMLLAGVASIGEVLAFADHEV